MPVQALASPTVPAVPAQAAMGGFPPSCPHPPASELRPAFYLSILSQIGHPPLVLPQAVFPSPLLSCSPPFSSYYQSNPGDSSHKKTIFSSNMMSAEQPRPHLCLAYHLFLCLHLTMALGRLSYTIMCLFVLPILLLA